MEHYDEPEGNDAELALIEPIKVAKTLQAISDTGPGEVVVPEKLYIEWAKVNVSEIEHVRQGIWADGMSRWWEVPDIEYKIAVDVATAKKLVSHGIDMR